VRWINGGTGDLVAGQGQAGTRPTSQPARLHFCSPGVAGRLAGRLACHGLAPPFSQPGAGLPAGWAGWNLPHLLQASGSRLEAGT